MELASGEIGIVVAHGQRANLPPVAAMVSASDNVNVEPVLRETRDRRFAVKAAVPPSGSLCTSSGMMCLALGRRQPLGRGPAAARALNSRAPADDGAVMRVADHRRVSVMARHAARRPTVAASLP